MRSIERAVPKKSSKRADLVGILKLSHALHSETNQNKLLLLLIRNSMQFANADGGKFIVFREEAPHILASGTRATEKIRVTQQPSKLAALRLPAAALQQAIRRKRVVSTRASSSKILRMAPEYSGRDTSVEAICIPVVKHKSVCAALYLEFSKRALLNSEDLSVLEFFATQALFAIENTRLYENLRRSEAFLAEGQVLSDTGSWTRDLRTGKLTWSTHLYRIFDLSPDSGPPPDYLEFVQMIHPDDLSEWRKAIEPGVAAGRWVSHEFRVICKSGQIKHIHTTGRPVRDSAGRLIEYRGTTMNITERRRREDELRTAQAELSQVSRLSTFGELAASIAHEINQPLSSIVTNAEACSLLLRKDVPDLDRGLAAVNRIIRDGRYTGEIIKSIRSMLQQASSEPMAIDVNQACLEVIELVRGEIRQQGVALQIDLASSSPEVSGDKVQLQQVVMNLVKNAIEAMVDSPYRPKTLRVASRCIADHVEVSVSDSGTGLSEDVADKIFDSFYTTKAKGMGMGLSISRTIIHAHGGRLTVSAGVPYGSVFVFSLPVLV